MCFQQTQMLSRSVFVHKFPGRVARYGFLVIAFVCQVYAATGSAPRISLFVDATETPRKIFHARMTIPAQPGTLTLYYPKWIPGDDGAPRGPGVTSATRSSPPAAARR